MIESLSPSVTSFVVTLIGASIALGACGVLVGTLTHRYRKQAIELAQRYLGARGEHRAAVGQLEKTLWQVNEQKREAHLASSNAQSTAHLNVRLQDQVLAAERKAHDLEDEARDLRSRLVRADTHTQSSLKRWPNSSKTCSRRLRMSWNARAVITRKRMPSPPIVTPQSGNLNSA